MLFNINIVIRAGSAALTGLLAAARRVAAALLAMTAALSFAGSAAATVGTGAPISLNSTYWSGSAGFGTIAPRAYFDDYGDVHLWGAAKQLPCPRLGCILGGDPSLLGTLPDVVAYAPDRNVYTIAHTQDGTYADVVIQPSGQIHLIGPRPPAVQDYSFVSLEGITYSPTFNDPLHPATGITLNPLDWFPDTKYGASPPAAFQDAGGTVHLEGGANHHGLSSQLGTLPKQYRPVSNVFTIAHTLNGTYADVAIGTDGSIGVIPPRLPAVPDFGFVSLEGISYDPGHPHPEIPNADDWDIAGPGFTAPFANAFPGVYEDSAGIGHLEGGVEAASCCIPLGDPVAYLFNPSLYPSWNVFEIVHTFNGTYADVEIGTDGTIRVIPPRSPAVPDFGFLSLDGLSFAAASPKFFALAVRGNERQGATIRVTLRRAREVALMVVRVTHHHRLIKVGIVRLGRHRAGTSQIRWNLRVNHRALPPGRYQVTLHALNGALLSVPAPPGARTLLVQSTGQVRVQNFPTGPVRVVSSTCSFASATPGRC